MIKDEFEDALDDDWVVSDSGFYDRYKPLRNKLRKFSAESVLEACMEKMNKFGVNSVEGFLAVPWLWIVVVKWKFIDDAGVVGGKRRM